MFRRGRSNDRNEEEEPSNRLSHLLLFLILCITFLLYFGYNDLPSKQEPPVINKIRANADDSSISYHNKTYLHSSFTLPQISLRLLNEITIHVESSTLENVFEDHVLSWKYMENSRIHFRVFENTYGLISISAHRDSSVPNDSAGKFIYFGLVRANRNICESIPSNSWTCQKDHDQFNNSFDSKYCLLVLKSNRLNDILQYTHDFLSDYKLHKSDMMVGMFCGNAVISRTANSENELYFINFNRESDYRSSPFFVCKFSTLLTDVIECFNTEVTSANLSLPLTLIHDPTTDVLVTANYNPENKNLNILTFNSSRLSFKAAYRSIPAPSGWLISIGKSSKGRVFFAGDAAPYEILGIYDVGNSRHEYHNLYL
ncbi:putative integral membrane protein [Theileria parva strain Muguga]|uniref:putative integral membrane protein n=1 Tax=Theileria parva strain Muguga TaxID=333668 RepID=UPI001C6228EC|nr:putative integral membrane protein [Theileria parva strain Muguga]EAN31879.2 putative integral membrane protein [Theileria parva strain Muguga]